MIEDAAKIYLPEREDWGNMSERLAALLTVPVRRVGRRYGVTEAPFEVVACEWQVAPFVQDWSKEICAELVTGALQDMANYLNGKFTEIRSYPISKEPPRDLYGIAYHDWCGVVQPMDVRVVIHSKTEIDDQGYPQFYLHFNLCTLVEK